MLAELLQRRQREILDEWVSLQLSDRSQRRGLISDDQLRDESRRFLAALRTGLQSGELSDVDQPGWSGARDLLRELSHSRAAIGFSPSETAMFVFSLKQPLFRRVTSELTTADDRAAAQQDLWTVNLLLDRLGLYTAEVYQEGREQIIARQQQEMMELSTPVVQLWDRILAVPLIGTLDSARTQVVMETLLQRIVEAGAEIAIIDITGVPTVDTLVAQHLLKTIAATRLMGADCIISGIRPQIAQTVVQLGVDLNVTSKATMAAALEAAIHRLGLAVVPGSVGRPGR